MVIVYRAENLIDAHLVQHRLVQSGLDAHVFGGGLTGGLGELPVIGFCQVVVPDEQAEDAMRSVYEYQAEQAQDTEVEQ